MIIPDIRVSALLFLMIPALAPQTEPASEEIGHLQLRRARVSWPAPESVVRDLRSEDEAVRLKALHLMGVTDPYSPAQPEAKITGQVLSKPEQIDLRYAALGDDAARQAIVAVQILQGTVAAVAVPKGQGWERIALFYCWCKYDLTNALGEFVEIRTIGEDRFELVVRGSGGGTGIYVQHEAHFRLHRTELRRMISFVSRRRSCPSAPIRPCEFEMRWLRPGVLVEARGRFDGQKVPEAVLFFPELQNRYITALTCKPLEWNPQTARYQSSGAAVACKPFDRASHGQAANPQ